MKLNDSFSRQISQFFKLWHGELKVLSKKASLYVSCRTILSEADADEDGKVSLDELTAWTRNTLKLAHKRETKQRLENLDTNKDGKVSWEEFQKNNKEDIGGINDSPPPTPCQLLHAFFNDLINISSLFQKKNTRYIKGSCLSNTSFIQFGRVLFFSAVQTLRRPI